MDKQLSPEEIGALCAQYTVPKTASLDVMKYREFLHQLELVFTVPVGASLVQCLPACGSACARDTHAPVG